jgi:hypothetical protein
MSKSYARIFRFLFARLTLMLGSQMRQSRREGAPMTGDDEKDGAKRVEPARPSKKSTEEVLKRVARPAWRSPLFWWLVEHHDAVRRDEAETGRGVPWRELCVDFVGMGITLADGRPVKPATAKKIWQRVRKEVVRVEERRAQERAEREARRAADPQQNMPSRFTGSFPAPLADRQPPLATTSSTAKPPAMNIQRGLKAGVPAAVGGPTEATRIGWTTPAAMTLTPSDRPMPGGPVPIGGWEERLSWEDVTIILDNEPFDLRLVLDPESQRDAARPWRLGDVSPEDEVRSFQGYLIDRFKSWRKDRRGYSANQIDRTWRKYLGKP